MTLINVKAVSEEAEARRATFREQQKERMVEVKEIRQAIVKLFDENPGEGFSNKEILEWLVGQGFNITFRQIAPKMNMIRNVFFEERVNGKAVWHRKVCDICKRPFELNDELWQWDKVNGIEAFCGKTKLEGHHTCFKSVSDILTPYKNKIDELESEGKQGDLRINELNEQIQTLLHDKGVLIKEVRELRSMIVFPSENQNSEHRHIEL